MARGKAHPTDIKAAVLAAILEGQGVGEIAKKYDLPKQTVSNLKKKLSDIELGQVGTEKSEKLIDLVEGHLSASLKAASNLAEKCSTDDVWIREQSASEIAALYGILSDKAIRILEAAQAVYQPETD
jgi:hypothetical protein